MRYCFILLDNYLLILITIWRNSITNIVDLTVDVCARLAVIDPVAVADIEPLRAQYRQIACWTNLGNIAGNVGLKARASIRSATASMISAQPPGR
jgi:hypothetical protein